MEEKRGYSGKSQKNKKKSSTADTECSHIQNNTTLDASDQLRQNMTAMGVTWDVFYSHS